MSWLLRYVLFALQLQWALHKEEMYESMSWELYFAAVFGAVVFGFAWISSYVQHKKDRVVGNSEEVVQMHHPICAMDRPQHGLSRSPEHSGQRADFCRRGQVDRVDRRRVITQLEIELRPGRRGHGERVLNKAVGDSRGCGEASVRAD